MHLVSGGGVRGETMTREMPVQGLAGWLLEAAARVVGRRRAQAARRKQMRVVETLAIGPKKQLVLVSCGGERFLVGTGADSVQTIVRVGPEARVAAAGLTAKRDLC